MGYLNKFKWYRKFKGGIWHYHKTYSHYWCRCYGGGAVTEILNDYVIDEMTVYKVDKGWIQGPICARKNNHYMKFYCGYAEDYTFPKAYLIADKSSVR